MKIRVVLASVLMTMLVMPMSAYGSNSGGEKTSKHSLEITTGYPSFILDMEYPTLNSQVMYKQNGKEVTTYFQPGLNLGYTFSWSSRWEVNAMANVHLSTYDLAQYPLLPEMEGKEPDRGNYDWNAEPISEDRHSKVGAAVCVAVRYKWLVRESFNLYSALGGSFAFSVSVPMPYVAPVGIQFGKGKVYGLAEVNVSAANTFGMVGFGIRVK